MPSLRGQAPVRGLKAWLSHERRPSPHPQEGPWRYQETLTLPCRRSSERTHGVGGRHLLQRDPGQPAGRPRPRDSLRSWARADASGTARPGPGPSPWPAAGGATGRRATGPLGQHVRPVLEGLPRGPGAQQHLADRLCPRQHQIHALGRSRPRCRRRGGKTAVSLALSEVPPDPLLQAAHLDLAEGHKEGEGLVEVRGGRALPGRRLSLLPLPLVQHGLDLHVGVWAHRRGRGPPRSEGWGLGFLCPRGGAGPVLACQHRSQASGLQRDHSQPARAGHAAQ